MPENVANGGEDDTVATRLSWEEQMELKDANRDADKVGNSAKHPNGEKLC